MTENNSSTIDFRAVVEQVGDRKLLRLPADASAGLPSRGQVAVVGTLAGREFTTVVEPDGKRGHWLNLDHTELPAGEAVDASLSPTKSWPEPDIPSDFQDALDHAPDTGELWSTITPMARWEWIRWVQATKSPSTRARRVDVGISKLRDGKRRPCCFDLASCTDPEVAKSGVLID
ncbi:MULTISPECIES: YdeI/OmpD-associated family protein [Gordonia]|jgi:hypothetical protein|uniref:YdeI/OmpD-associated family protein n=1 Tax=Gordonia TaxID=2053 RepID=UPI0030C79BFA